MREGGRKASGEGVRLEGAESEDQSLVWDYERR